MRITTLTILAVFLFAPAAFAGPGDLPEAVPDCNWGEVTSGAITEQDFPQGEHASQQPTPRSGLPNIGLYEGQQGDLEATCEFVDENLPS
jgi:hypothetical protein